jgi:hypothetical protein
VAGAGVAFAIAALGFVPLVVETVAADPVPPCPAVVFEAAGEGLTAECAAGAFVAALACTVA